MSCRPPTSCFRCERIQAPTVRHFPLLKTRPFLTVPAQLLRSAPLVLEYHRIPAFLDVSLRQLGEVLVQPHEGFLRHFSSRPMRGLLKRTRERQGSGSAESPVRSSCSRESSASHADAKHCSRESTMSAFSLRESGVFDTVAEQGQAAEPEASPAEGCALYLRRELSMQKLSMLPLPRAGNQFHLYVSKQNAGASRLVQELRQRQQLDLKPPLLLKVTSEPDDLLRCERMLLYLNGQTWATSGPNALPGCAASLGMQVRRAMTLGVPLLLVHERPSLNQAAECYAVPFESFLSDPSGATPLSIVRHGVYREIACPMMGGAHRQASLFMLHTLISKGVRVRSVLWVTLSDAGRDAMPSLQRSLTGALTGTAPSMGHGRSRMASVPAPRFSRMSKKTAEEQRRLTLETVDVLRTVFSVPVEEYAKRMCEFSMLAMHDSDGTSSHCAGGASRASRASRASSAGRAEEPPPQGEHAPAAAEPSAPTASSVAAREAGPAQVAEAATVGPLEVEVVVVEPAATFPSFPSPPPHPSPGIPGARPQSERDYTTSGDL